LGTGASQPRIAIAFTCCVCSTRNHKMFSKHAYENGVVVIRCDCEQ
jgi:protein import protein ZIM17